MEASLAEEEAGEAFLDVNLVLGYIVIKKVL